MSECAIDEMVESRFWFVGITGTVFAVFGVISNALLAVFFLSRRSYRNSPFFFLGFVAFYDTLLDFTYIVLLVIGNLSDNVPMSGLFNIISIFLPFITLVFLNSGIVMMLRKQHIQGLYSYKNWEVLWTHFKLHFGLDQISLHSINIELLRIKQSLDFLHTEHGLLYRTATDIASVLTVVGNAIRCPAHLISNKDLRHHFSMMLFGENNKVDFILGTMSNAAILSLENLWITVSYIWRMRLIRY
uniref:G-protein coupled receptors family 1 profile domain-containing protein n=1 Tax=Parascaris equorum TaxID=6256 RepID=A0A914R8Z5_PAREQ